MSTNNSKKIEINQENITDVLNKVVENIAEERTLALDRFKRQDESIDSSDQFILQGKTLAEYLRIAQSCTDALFNIAKLQASIVYKNDLASSNSSMGHDDIQKMVQKMIMNEDSSVDDVEIK